MIRPEELIFSEFDVGYSGVVMKKLCEKKIFFDSSSQINGPKGLKF